MIDIPNIMNEDIMIIDRDFLLIGLAGILNIEIDWDDNLVITDKKAYNTNEFLIKFISKGRKVLYKNQVGEILQCFKAHRAMQNKQLIKNNRKVRVNNMNALQELHEELEAFLNKGYEIYEMLEITTKIKRVEL